MTQPPEDTAPVDLDRTQEIESTQQIESTQEIESPAEHTQPVTSADTSEGTPPEAPPWDPWAVPLGDPAHAADRSSSAGSAWNTPEQPVHPVHPAHPVESVAPVDQAAPANSAGRGPGWAALLLVATICTLLAGLGGGLLGGWLAVNGQLPFDGAQPGPTGAPAPMPTGEPDATPTPGQGATTRPQGSIANIAALAMPSVVTIKVTNGSSGGTGSGWVYDDNGHIVTNNHVVSDGANGGTITVVLSNGKQSTATVVGSDSSYDLAVLKVDRTDLTPLPLGDSADVVVGDQVIAVGAPLGLESTVTAGIVSALDRPVVAGGSGDTSFINAIQTDAAINPGNSGGPLLNMSGEVIGVNSAIATAPGSMVGGTAGNIGVGFAIPAAQVAKTVEQLITTGRAVHPVIGVYLDRTYQGEGVKILDSTPDGQPSIVAGGPAAKAGLLAGDVIVALNGRPMTDPDALVVGIRALDVGDTVTLTVRRDGTDRDVTMVLEASGNS